MIEQEDARLNVVSPQQSGGSAATEPHRPALTLQQHHVIVHMAECGHRVDSIASCLKLPVEIIQQAIERGYAK